MWCTCLAIRFIKERQQKEQTEVAVATKFAALPWRFGRGSVLSALKKSLDRLGLPSVELYQLHWSVFLCFIWYICLSVNSWHFQLNHPHHLIFQARDMGERRYTSNATYPWRNKICLSIVPSSISKQAWSEHDPFQRTLMAWRMLMNKVLWRLLESQTTTVCILTLACKWSFVHL